MTLPLEKKYLNAEIDSIQDITNSLLLVDILTLFSRKI